MAWTIFDVHSDFPFSIANAMIGEPLRNVRNDTPIRLWNLLQGEANWQIWKARCSLVMDGVEVQRQGIQIRIWKELRLHIKIDWGKLLIKVDEGKLSLLEAATSLRRDYGRDGVLFKCDGRKI